MLLASPPRATALDANNAAYVGGTVLSLNAAHRPIEGRLDFGSNELVFAGDAGPHATAHLRIDCESIRGLALWQVQHRRPSYTDALGKLQDFKVAVKMNMKIPLQSAVRCCREWRHRERGLSARAATGIIGSVRAGSRSCMGRQG